MHLDLIQPVLKTDLHTRQPARRIYPVQGSVRDREFEVRRGDRLAAVISWQDEAGKLSPRGEYFVEILRGEDALALLGIVVAVEIAVGPVEDS